MTVPGDHGRAPDDDPLARRYRELGGLGARAAGAPDLGDLLRRDRRHERRRVTATALAVVSTMGAAAWVGSAVLGIGRTTAPQTVPAAQVAAPTSPRPDPAGTGPRSTARPTPSPTLTPTPTQPSTPTSTSTPTVRSSSGGSGTRTVQVWFESGTTRADGCHPLKAVTRTVADDDLVTATLHQLLLGPTRAEQQSGLRSDFGPGSAAATTVTHAGGTVIVDFAGLGRLSSVPTACRRTQVATPLNQTLAQFTSVKTRVFTLRGDAAAFRAYLNPPASPTPAPAG